MGAISFVAALVSAFVFSSCVFGSLVPGNSYTPEMMTQKYLGKNHPREFNRTTEWVQALLEDANTVMCAQKFLTNHVNMGIPSRVQHGKHIGSALVRFEVLEVPSQFRFGLYSTPAKYPGVIHFTKGKGKRFARDGEMDVLGGSVRIFSFDSDQPLHEQKIGFGDLTMTNTSRHFWSKRAKQKNLGGRAFGKNHRDFTNFLRAQFQLAEKLNFLGSVGHFMGERLGLGLFLSTNWGTAKVLIPAVTGFKDSQLVYPYGSGHPYLLNESAEMEQRRAFKFGIELNYDGLGTQSENSVEAQAILKEYRGLFAWFRNKFRGIFYSEYLEKAFVRWIHTGEIQFVLYGQLEDFDDPTRTPIEDPRKGWDRKPVPLAIITLYAQDYSNVGDGDNPIYYVDNGFRFNPGNVVGGHLPLSDLGMGRALGQGSYRTSSGGWSRGDELEQAAARVVLAELQRLDSDFQMTLRPDEVTLSAATFSELINPEGQ